MAGLVGAPLKGGFNQNGGGYYFVLSSIASDNLYTYSGSSGSGGSFAVGSFQHLSTLGIGTSAGQAPANYSVPFLGGRVIRDMGKTIVSSGRTFRKFQGLLTTAGNSSPSFGVSGNAGGTVNPGYMTAYLEVTRDGSSTAGANGLPQIVRYA